MNRYVVSGLALLFCSSTALARGAPDVELPQEALDRGITMSDVAQSGGIETGSLGSSAIAFDVDASPSNGFSAQNTNCSGYIWRVMSHNISWTYYGFWSKNVLKAWSRMYYGDATHYCTNSPFNANYMWIKAYTLDGDVDIFLEDENYGKADLTVSGSEWDYGFPSPSPAKCAYSEHKITYTNGGSVKSVHVPRTTSGC